jgi:predicted outer membrane repeat protein
LQDSIVRNNQAPGGGGGGMFNSGNGGTATATMERVTFTGNSADGGGAIYNNGGNSGNASPTVRNSTFYANTASQGGAMLNYAPSAGHASPVLRYVTFNHNNATSTGGAMYNFAPSGGDAAPNMSGVILWADEPNENVVNFSLTVSSIEYSIMPDCPPAAVGCIETDPLLGPLQNNGGFAPTMRPEIGSPAIDNGNATNCPADDERGTARPQAAQCDIGAVELRAAETQRCYVNGAAGPTDNGLTWATAYKTLTSGLADTNCTEVWVAQGTYKPTTGVDRNSAYYLPPGKAVYGGFAATETLRSQRNPVAHETILSGEIGAAGDASDNVYHVIVADAAASAANIGGNTVLDGFTITGGYAEGTNLQHFGGGLLCNGQGYSCNPTLSNLVFSGNHAQYGGGLANYGFGGVSSPTLKNVTFTGNSASNAGGGVYNAGSSGVSSPELSAVTFTNNTAHDNGGAMSSFGNAGISNPQVTDSTFVGNTSTFDGGAVSVKAASGSYVRVVFSGNGAGTRGGAVLVDDINGQCSPTFTSVSFVAGTAANGGAVNNALNHVGTSTATFNDVSFVNNTASQAGGAVFSNGGSTSYSDALFLGNGDVLTTQQGGAIATLGGNASVVVDRAAFVNNAAFSLGGAVWTTVDSAGGADASTQITNATFWGNEARSGSAVATRSNGAAQTATATLRSVTFAANTASFGNGTIYTDAINGGSSDSTVINAIFWGNDTAVQVYNGVNTTTTIDHAVVQGSCQSGNLCTNISLLDPLLGNLQYNSGSTPTLMPAANSPAVNFGANCPAVDQRGVARPQGVACDVGAVERRAIEDHIFSDGFDF